MRAPPVLSGHEQIDAAEFEKRPWISACRDWVLQQGWSSIPNHLKLGWGVPCWAEFVGIEQGPVWHPVISFPLIRLFVPLSQRPESFQGWLCFVCVLSAGRQWPSNTLHSEFVCLIIKSSIENIIWKCSRCIKCSLFRDIYPIMSSSNSWKISVFWKVHHKQLKRRFFSVEIPTWVENQAIFIQVLWYKHWQHYLGTAY